MAHNAAAADTGPNTPVRRTGRPRKPNMRFADDEMDDTVRKIVTGVSTPPDGSQKKGAGRGGSGGRKDGSGQRKGSRDEDPKGLERVLADSAVSANITTTSLTMENEKEPKTVNETGSDSNIDNISSSPSNSSRRSTRGQPYTSPVKDGGDLLKDSNVSLTLVPAKQVKIKKKFNLDTLKGRKFPVKGNMVVLDMKQSSIVTVKPKQIKDLIQLESNKQIKDLIQLENKTSKVLCDPVKLETEPVKLESGPVKLTVTKLMCEESESEESSLSGSGVKNIYKIGNIDCFDKPKDEKTSLLLSESEFSDKTKRISLNEPDKVRDELVSNVGNVDNERKMECDIASNQVKPRKRGRPKKERSQDKTEELNEETGNKGIQEKMEIPTNQTGRDKEELNHDKLSDNDTTSEKEKSSILCTVEGEEKEFNVTSKRERDSEQKKMGEEKNNIQSIDSPKLKKRKASNEYISETDKQKDKGLGNKKYIDNVKEEQKPVDNESKGILFEKDTKNEKENKKISQIERPNEKVEKENVKQEGSPNSFSQEEKVMQAEDKDEVSTKPPTDIKKISQIERPKKNIESQIVKQGSTSSFSQEEKVLPAEDKDKVNTQLTTDVKKEISMNKSQSLEVVCKKSQMTVKNEIKKESDSILSGSKRKCDEKEGSISEREKTMAGSSCTKKFKTDNEIKTPEKDQTLFKKTDEEMEVPKDMMGIAHVMSFLRRPPRSTPQIQEKLNEEPKKVEVKKEVTKKIEENNSIKEHEENESIKKMEEQDTIKKTEEACIIKENDKIIIKKAEGKDVVKKAEENKEVLKKPEEKKEEARKVEEKNEDIRTTEETQADANKIENKKEDVKKMKNKKDDTITLENYKSPSKSEAKIEDIKKTEEKKKENNEKKKVESTLKPLMTDKKNSPKKVERPLTALMHECKEEKRKKEETNKLNEKKDEEESKEEIVLEIKSKKVKLEDEDIRQKVDESKKKEETRREQEKTMIEGQRNELEKDKIQINIDREKVPKGVKEKVSKEENTEIKSDVYSKDNPTNLNLEKTNENIADTVKIEAKKSDTLISEEKNKSKKSLRSSSNSPCHLVSRSQKPSKEKEVRPLDLLMKNFKESDTESDGSLTEISHKKVPKEENVEVKSDVYTKEMTKSLIPEKKNENITEKVKIEEAKRPDYLISEEKNKNKKGLILSSNSPCNLISRCRKPSKEKEVRPLDLLMKNVKESDTESDGSLTEISRKKGGKKNKILIREKTVDSDSENNSKKGKKKDKDGQSDKVLAKKEDKVLAKKEEKVLAKKEEKVLAKKEEKVLAKKEEKVLAKKEEKVLAKKEEKVLAKKEEKVLKKEEKVLAKKEQKVLRKEEKVLAKKEEMNRRYLHIEKCIENVINAAMAEYSPKKVMEKKKENIIEKEVNISKSEYDSPKKEVKKDDEKSKKAQEKRKSIIKKKTDEKSKQVDDRKNDDENLEEKSKLELEKKKVDEENRKKDDKRKLEDEKKRTEDEKRKKGEDLEVDKKKVEEEKRKKTNDKKKVETNNANVNDNVKCSPANKKMSQSASSSPSRPTPKSARKLYKDEDIKRKVDEEKKKEDEKLSVKEELGIAEKKKKDDMKKKEEERKVDSSHKSIKDNDNQNKDIAMEIDESEEVKKKTDDKKRAETNNATVTEGAKSSPAHRKMSRSASNSPSRPTPRSARKLYKDDDVKRTVDEEKKKDDERISVKEEPGFSENKKTEDGKKKEEERKADSSHRNITDNEIQNKDITIEIDESENVLNKKEVKKESDSENNEFSKETQDNKENVVPKDEIKSEIIEHESEEDRLEAEKKKKIEEEAREKRNKAVVEARMKSFVHLSENLYISERKKSKRNKELRRMTCDCYLTKEEITTGEVGCGDDCLNRLLMVECGSRCKTKEHCSNKRFQNRENADVEVFNAEEKGCGVRARTDIEAGTFLMEYIGEVFDTKEFKRRRREYAKDGGAHFYFMSLRSDELIDATRKGNISRFVNHSCDPIAETQKWTVNGDLRIGFFSKKFIKAGEEITFDYRMERYGREPQKCYCGTAVCRGWLGEPPDQKTKEEKEEDKKREEKEKRRQERRTFDDMDLEDEIEKLGCVGLRNRQDTLNLSRLMVRAMDDQSRVALLKLLREGEPACRRLFLDYHGLRVLWSWMADIGSQQGSAKLKMEILTTLGDLPITNKTQLTDSRVFSYVEKWSQLLASQNTSTTTTIISTPPATHATKKTSDISEDSDTEVESGNGSSSNGEGRSSSSSAKTVESSSTDDSSSLDSSDAAAPSKAHTDECKVDDDNSDSNLSLPTKSPSSSSGSSDSQEKQEERELLQNIVDTTLKLLDQWKNLKEAFRIPKKERIELMKEHERQVDQDYQEFLVRNTTLERGKSRSSTPSYYSSRIIRRSPDRDRDRHRRRNNNNNNENDNSDSPNLSKEERRQQFALKVQQEEEEASIRKEEEAAQRKMQEEMWQLHVDRCRLLCQDPYLTPILDPTCQYFWDPRQNNWQPYSGPVPALGVGGKLSHNSASEGDSNSSSPLVPPSHLDTPPQPLPGNLAPDSDPAHPTGTNTNTFPGLGQDDDPLNPANIPLPGESPSKQSSTPGGDTSPAESLTLSSIPLPGEMTQMPTPTTPTTPGTPESGGLGTPLATGLPPGTKVGIDEGLPPPPPVGPITITLPPKWKIARDPRGHVYFYHAKTRISQWEIPTMEQHRMLEQTLNLHQDSDSDSVSSDDSDSSESTDSDEFSSDEEEEEEDEETKVVTLDDHTVDEKMIRCPKGRKKRSAALVQERVISPILEVDREAARQERHKAKERAREEARQERRDVRKEVRQEVRQERLFDQGDMQQRTHEEERHRRDEKKSKIRHKDRVKMKERLSYALADNSDRARRIKENFKAEVAMFIVSVLNPYRRSDCFEGKINSIEDFKYLGKKLTHFVLVKELRQLPNMESLEFSESVKNKTRDFINKYMKKFGAVFKRDPNDTKDYN